MATLTFCNPKHDPVVATLLDEVTMAFVLERAILSERKVTEE
jgi:hypothetical protein